MWEASIFKKDKVTISDNFIAIYGTWLPSNSKILFVDVYAPQRTSCKRILWDYISTILGRWNGEAIIMGDFNEVRSVMKDVDHVSTPTALGYLIGSFLIRAWTMLLWKEKKLQDLKVIIRRWIKVKRLEMSGSKIDIVTELGAIDKDMDRGVVNDDNVLRRLELKRNLLNVTVMEAKDRYQKSKVKWAIEGDENSKFFHGIINKRRSQLAIRGIFVDGIWRTDPDMIKNTFFNHFEARFQEPPIHIFKLNLQFHKKLLQSQADDLERCVSRDEIRRAVWDCGDNKSPGPDGYTFEYLRSTGTLSGQIFVMLSIIFL
nr:RNA-directed DNA polymerase, eukaryota [Tanacetum cinerariifolium]